jgi:sulfide dehydrogenase cytochrome subunit
MRRAKRAIALAAGGLLLSSAGAAAQGPSGAVLTNTCFSCHGTDGHSVGAMPSIAGKNYEYVVEALLKFKNGERAATVMDRIAKGFSDEEIESLARYFSGQ